MGPSARPVRCRAGISPVHPAGAVTDTVQARECARTIAAWKPTGVVGFGRCCAKRCWRAQSPDANETESPAQPRLLDGAIRLRTRFNPRRTSAGSGLH
jgi:hypothetical protein